MNKIKYFLLFLLLLCVLSIYYNIFLSIFSFDFVKIVDIEIKKQINYNVETNSSTYNPLSVPTFIANLENNKNCKIDISNEIMISNIKKNIKSRKKNYYAIIDEGGKKNICSIFCDGYEIIITHISFYIAIIMFSIITMNIIVEYITISTISTISTNIKYINNPHTNNKNIKLVNNSCDEKKSDLEKNILDDYVCV